MKAYIISDNMDTLVSMQLAGVDGVVVHNKTDIIEFLDRFCNDKSIGIIIITEKIGELAKDKIDKIRLYKKLPLIIEIPDRFGTSKEDGYILKYIKSCIGINLWGEVWNKI